MKPKVVKYLAFIIYLFFFNLITSKLNGNLIEVTKINSNIKLDIKYATENNFLNKKIYPCSRCYLEQEVAPDLSKVQKELEDLGQGLKIFDGYRPLYIQKIFWNFLPDERYVANPKKGSRHNRGASVDLTLINLKTEKELEMPSKYDDFTESAHRNYKNMKNKKIKQNCKLLELIMEKHKFIGLKTEWWHFDHKNWQKFSIKNIDFKALLQSKDFKLKTNH